MAILSLRVFMIMVICCCATFAESMTMKYKDPTQPLRLRINDLMLRMTLEEKIGQMTQIDREVATRDVMKDYFIGSVKTGGTSFNMVNELQKGSLSTRLGIPMMYGNNDVNGNSNAYGATIFPQNIALEVTRDPELKKAGAPYYEAIRKGVATIKVSYPSRNGHKNKELITELLKDKLKFRGFVISDFMSIDMITGPAHASYAYLIEQSVGAGVDMIMVGNNYKEFIDGLTSLVKNKVIPMRQINDAVRRILRVKFILGLFENPLNTDLSNVENLGELVERQNQQDMAMQAMCIDQSMIPLRKRTARILAAPTHADNNGNQCGR
ncbi:glycoside hydrolase family 3 C-terminal domain-containing protein [Artemisia annua]|uniref:Glycoside hydrolase family 3 C-terminal domain-containing protein n=1 Tax=Artemisia annua TaxID=35608 RepID=A0A2U1M5Z4_ARTAN|nr:glycoside hydrolase family 3 C-terminal domain-containing protein [Artemisia annua]